MAHTAHMAYPGYVVHTRVPTVSHVMIDHLSGTPVYQQLAAILRDGIKRGDPAPDRPLPSYTTLMQEHDVARGTAAKAVQVLVEEGLVRIVPGRGAYVIPEGRRPG
jgi:GntR family transcriptional regulator